MAKNIFLISGTRPEVIKMAPVYFALKKESYFNPVWISTGQHKEMIQPLLDHFKIRPDYNFEIMEPSQSLSGVSAKVLNHLSKLKAQFKENIDGILVQGDTTSAMAAALFAFQEKIPLGHIEAGLRTQNIQSPYPEEFNRRVISLAADLHFAPTKDAQSHLLKEEISADRVFITGNTSIDALLWTMNHTPEDSFSSRHAIQNKKFVLITLHRRENWGKGLDQILDAILELANSQKESERLEFVFPVHLNPAVRKPIFEKLNNFKNIHLIEPLSYQDFSWAMKQAHFIITDSGGVQEEALTFGTPILVTRENTERPEALKTGLATLVGTDKKKIISKSLELLNLEKNQNAIQNPYGDGTASFRIATELLKFFQSKGMNEKA